MSFNWSDYLTLAQVLEGTPEDAILAEASFRSATSRAYYAAFNLAKNHARSEDFYPIGGYDHENIPSFFRNSDGVIRKEIGAKLGRMRDNRNQADYDTRLLHSSPRALADMTVKMAREVVSLIDSLSQS